MPQFSTYKRFYSFAQFEYALCELDLACWDETAVASQRQQNLQCRHRPRSALLQRILRLGQPGLATPPWI